MMEISNAISSQPTVTYSFDSVSLKTALQEAAVDSRRPQKTAGDGTWPQETAKEHKEILKFTENYVLKS